MKLAGSTRRTGRPACWLWLSALFLAACGGGEYVPPTAPPPRTALQVEHPPEPGPEHGFDPRAFYGKRALSVQRGAASFYADRFSGRRTANGERYDPNAYTCAHRTLPFGSIVRVVYERTGDWVLVRVNDRGPYGPRRRIIDLSREAARRLAMLQDGVVRVRLELLQLGDGKVTRAERAR
jgi:rare lipoprotein A